MALSGKESTAQKIGGLVPEVELNRILSQRTHMRPGDGDLGSNYALQVALRNMKERCQKQQKKIDILEEENERLIHNKSELYEEIAKLRETQIKLREKNLHLSQEIHTKHQEGCTFRENLNSLSKEHAELVNQHNKILQENQQLKDDVQQLAEENAAAQESLRQIAEEPSKGRTLPSVSRSVMVQTDVWEDKSKSRLQRGINTIGPNDPRSQHLRDLHKRYSAPQIASNDGDALTLALNINADKEYMKKVQEKHQQQTSSDDTGILPPEDSAVLETLLKQQENLQLVKSRLQMQKSILAFCVQKLKEKESSDARCNSVEMANELTKLQAWGTPDTTPRDKESTNRWHGQQQVSSGGTNPYISVQKDLDEIEMERGMVSVNLNDESAAATTTTTLVPKEVRSACTSPISQTATEEMENICPMCEAVFPHTMPRDDFENHVLSHFENTESLLKEYEML